MKLMNFYARSHNHKKERFLASLCPSIRPSAFISAVPTGRISVRFDVEDFYENVLNLKMW